MLVIEGTDPFEVDNLAEAIVSFRSSVSEIFHKSTEEMTKEEELEYFGKVQ